MLFFLFETLRYVTEHGKILFRVFTSLAQYNEVIACISKQHYLVYQLEFAILILTVSYYFKTF